MPIEFQRELLYEEIWTVPLVQLAKKYGLSDHGLRKICQVMSIPLPASGHWAKVAAGHVIARPPLPPAAGNATVITAASRESPYRLPEDDAWLAERDAFEQRPENRLVVDLHPKQWHTTLAPLRDRLRLLAKKCERAMQLAQVVAKRPLTQREDDEGGYGWRSLILDGQILAPRHRSAPMKVTPVTLERSLAICNCLLAAAERRGFTVGLTAGDTRFHIAGHGGSLSIYFMDRLKDGVHIERRGNGDVARHPCKVPTGILRLGIENAGYRTVEFADKAQPLEAQLNAAFAHIYRQIVRCRESRRQGEEHRRQQELEMQRRALEEEQRREAARREAEERQRRAGLLTEAMRWRDSQAIRQYVQHVLDASARDAPPLPAAEALTQWTTWALRVADELDPTDRRLPR